MEPKTILQRVRKLATDNDIVLILMSTQDLENVLAVCIKICNFSRYCSVWEKLGNGYAVSAVVGPKKLCNRHSQHLNSTFWTERLALLR